MNRTIAREELIEIAEKITGLPSKQILEVHITPDVIEVYCLVPASKGSEYPWKRDGTGSIVKEIRKIRWHKMPIRSQETILRWVFDDE